ncbi:MAG: NrfD/PsrC family molybdoenzyme membrane anchor subunit [Dehalococcoidia bacterium]|nr:NrfD/PsrC family molybdoenzyme membrane anchor subunit [Dehalococcoidia bacterium]
MVGNAVTKVQNRSWLRERIFLGMSIGDYVKGLLTPFNLIAGVIILLGLVFLVLRFVQGLGAVTGASQDQPWGLFLSWGLFSGIPLAATGFVLGTAVYVFNLKQYHPVVRNAVLLGLLGYLFAVIFLLIDLGRPWRLPFPMVLSYGTVSALFLVAWTVALHLTCYFLELSPSICEWGGWKTLREWMSKMSVGLAVFVMTLSTLHQSALGALYLLAPGKLHPLWYSSYLPWLFLISAIAAGICMVIVVSWVSKRFLKKETDAAYLASLDRITLGLGTGAAFVLFTYFGLKLVALAQGNNWDLLNTGYGYWFLVELFGFVLLPALLLVFAVRRNKVGLVQLTAGMALIGVIINRLNVSLIAINWELAERELFNWREFLIILSIVTIEVLVYRWVVRRMPVLRAHPEFKAEEEEPELSDVTPVSTVMQ